MVSPQLCQQYHIYNDQEVDRYAEYETGKRVWFIILCRVSLFEYYVMIVIWFFAELSCADGSWCYKLVENWFVQDPGIVDSDILQGQNISYNNLLKGISSEIEVLGNLSPYDEIMTFPDESSLFKFKPCAFVRFILEFFNIVWSDFLLRFQRFSFSSVVIFKVAVVENFGVKCNLVCCFFLMEVDVGWDGVQRCMRWGCRFTEFVVLVAHCFQQE